MDQPDQFLTFSPGGRRLLLAASLALALPAPAVPVEHEVWVPMRDGVRLMADIFRPDEPGPHPVLVVRSGHDRRAQERDAPRYAAAGYIVVAEDVRGRYGSEGEYDSIAEMPADSHEAEDGYDTIEWAARLPGSNGKVGTFGLSEAAGLQWKFAALRPPHLVAMAASTTSVRFTKGDDLAAFEPLPRLRSIFVAIAPEYRRRAGIPGPSRRDLQAAWELEGPAILWFLPRTGLPDSFWGSAREAAATRAWLRDPVGRNTWDFAAAAPEITVPNICFVGWYDANNSAIDIRTAVLERGGSELARRNQQLIIGPWIHTGYRNRKIGALDFGPEAAVDIVAPQIRWFDHWLKGADNGVENDSPVRIFTMGVNRWRDEKAWPPASAVSRDFYLAGEGAANTPAGDGRLAAEVPAAAADHYRYDPRDPVPSLMGMDAHAVPADQGLLRYRRDILVYQTPPLSAPLEATGYPEVELFAASSAADTDFFFRLIDVSPDGRAIDVDAGRVRARYRDSLENPRFLVPGQPTRFRVRLGPTSMQFLTGHRIRLDVTSSDFPAHERNHNTAADYNQNDDTQLLVAEQTVFHGGAQASRLILPVVERP